MSRRRNQRRGRPAGDVRRALAQAVQSLLAKGRTITWRSLAAAARVGADRARRTVCEMLRAGQLVRIGTLRTARTGRPMSVLAPPELADDAEMRRRAQQAGELLQAMRAWGQAVAA